MSTADEPQFCTTCLHHFPTLNDFQFHRYAVSARQCIDCYTGLRFPNRCEYLRVHRFYGCQTDPPTEPVDGQETTSHNGKSESETAAGTKSRFYVPHCQACQLQDLSDPAAVEYHEISCKPAATLPARYCGPCALLYSTTTEIHQQTALHLQYSCAWRNHWHNVSGSHGKGEAKFECTKCGLVAPRKGQMKDHGMHSQYLQCRHCERSFTTICNLSKHLQDHDGLSSRPLHVLVAKHLEDVPKKPPAPAVDYRCCDCKLTFTKKNNFKRHVVRCKLIPRQLRVVCQDCELEFSSLAGKIQHLQILNACRPVKCAGKDCEKRFKLAAHMIQHLESGSCVSGFDRNEIHGLISKHDSGGTITIPAIEDHTVTAHNNEKSTVQEYVDDDSDTEVMYTPSTSGILTPASGFSTGTTLSFPDPRTCPICYHTFASVQAAVQHGLSPVHDPPRYQCPSNLFFVQLGLPAPFERKTHVRAFKTLAGLLSHLRNCAGTDSEETWKRVVGELVGRLQSGGVRLVGN